jgi:[acyl-carrier-protein] S-malonyltransferase
MTSKIDNPTAPAISDIFQTAERVLGYDLRSLCLQGPQEVLNQTVHCQPAVVVASLAALEDLKNVHPQVTTPSSHAHPITHNFCLLFAGVFEL